MKPRRRNKLKDIRLAAMLRFCQAKWQAAGAGSPLPDDRIGLPRLGRQRRWAQRVRRGAAARKFARPCCPTDFGERYFLQNFTLKHLERKKNGIRGERFVETKHSGCVNGTALFARVQIGIVATRIGQAGRLRLVGLGSAGAPRQRRKYINSAPPRRGCEGQHSQPISAHSKNRAIKEEKARSKIR